MATLEEKQSRIREATVSGFRGQLLARGQARAMIWGNGELPADAPAFSPLLSYDLLSYGYALLSDGLDILEGNGDAEIARTAFENAAQAIESVTSKGTDDTDRDFHHFVAAAAYHLARYSARAFSLLSIQIAQANLTLSERCLAFLMIRSLDDLEDSVRAFKLSDEGEDESLASRLAAITDGNGGEIRDGGGEETELDVIDSALTEGFVSAMATAMLAFECGDPSLIESARQRLVVGMECCAELHFVPQWWCHRLAAFLITDLWTSSFHERLPTQPPDATLGNWPQMREIFVASLYRRSRAEIDLWPSQLDAANRALDLTDDMVVSLPTSAGKTRIAELCIMACLAASKRVIFITPLRALSAQTEVSLERTFTPLGKSVSSLYGGIGLNGVDNDLLRERDIIVATPEKLDFALRNDPSLLDDIGLVVLDEGHMIGLGEREVRYEVQIQKLLRRNDAAGRRIVCLSAILPDGDKLNDFVGWLTGDNEDGLIQRSWRPTRLRFGEIEWRQDHGRLEFSIDQERPFVPRYITQTIPTSGRRRKPFPSNQKELCLATAWRLVEDGQTVLIFCPLRKSVEPFAKLIVQLHRQDLLPSLLDAELDALDNALTIGVEWFASDHPLLICLKLGIAVHHGALPTPYRREVERLLRDGILKVTISSPTLAQGLNLTASALIFHTLHRNREMIDISEFRNVTGRAGRAFIDVRGQVLYPMFDNIIRRRANWQKLIEDTSGKEMESGLLLLVRYLLARMVKKYQPEDSATLIEYVANTTCWEFPELSEENEEQKRIEEKRWYTYVTILDTAILSLIGGEDIPNDEIEDCLDAVLQSSLWTRQLGKHKETIQTILKIALIERSRYVWSNTTATQRRAYFLAGVGLSTGLRLDDEAEGLNKLLVDVNAYILNGDEDNAVVAMTEFADILFQIPPFTPNTLPDNWKDLLAAWLRGEKIVTVEGGDDPDTLRFIEDALIYRLPWGMEAVRVRGLAHDDRIGDGSTLADFDLGRAVAAVETGTLKVSAAVLIKAGFSSRTAAIKAVTDGSGTFRTVNGLKYWARSDPIKDMSVDQGWPTPETHDLWRTFVESLHFGQRSAWRKSEATIQVDWYDGITPTAGLPVRLVNSDQNFDVFSADYEPIGTTDAVIAPKYQGILRATVSDDTSVIKLSYLGPENLFQHLS